MIDKHLELRDRTKQFSFRIIRLFKALPHTGDADVIGKQLLRCSTAVAANCRAAGRCRTKPEFANKLRIVLEEADEVVYWLECIEEAKLFPPTKTAELIQEANELVSIFAASLRTLTGGRSPDHQIN